MKKTKKEIIILMIISLILITPSIAFAEDPEVAFTCDDFTNARKIYNSLRILAPFLLMVFGSIDYIKAIVASDVKKQQEARSKFPKRIIAFLLLIILPFFVSFLFTELGKAGAQNTAGLCCVLTSGTNCNLTGGNFPTNNNNDNNDPNNSDYVDEDEDNMPGGPNYISPVTRRKTTTVSTCINSYYGECNGVNASTGNCTCTYTSRENLSKASLCENDPYHVGMKVQQEGSGGATHVTCYYNARLSESGQTIGNLTALATTPSLLGKIAKTNNNYDAYFGYERKVTTTDVATCNSYENSQSYCTSQNNCICIYGKGIVPSSQASDDDYNRTIDNSIETRNANINRYNILVNLLNTAQLAGSQYYNEYVIQFKEWYPGAYYPVSQNMISVVDEIDSFCSINYDTDLSFIMKFNSSCDSNGISGGAKDWLLGFYQSSFDIDLNSASMAYINYDTISMLTTYIHHMDNFYTENRQVFMINMEEFNQLNRTFGLPEADINDFNTEKLYQCIKRDGSLYDCAN